MGVLGWWSKRLERFRFTNLLGALLLLALGPLFLHGPLRRVGVGIAFLLVLLAAVAALVPRRGLLGLSWVVGGTAIVLQIAELVAPGRAGTVRPAVAAAFLVFATAVVISDVMRSERVTLDKIQGAVCGYFLIGVSWGVVFTWLHAIDPGAFQMPLGVEAQAPVDPMIYFSFVTLTTLGYGDVLPVSHAARTLSWMEAALGQIYLAVLVARLVGLHLVHERDAGWPRNGGNAF